MSIKRTTSPAPPITLQDIAGHARVDEYTEEEGLIGGYIKAATDMAERILSRQLMTATYEVKMDRFPGGTILLPYPPLQAVSSISYYDINETITTLDPSTYYVDVDSEPGRIVVKNSWPLIYDRPNAVTITFTAGYASAGDIPDNIITFIRSAATLMYDHRDSLDDKLIQSLAFAFLSSDRVNMW